MSTVPPSPSKTRRESFANGLTVRIDEQGSGRPILVLHGGGGSQTMTGLASALAAHAHAHVLTPTHPGFGGEPRPEWFKSVNDIAIAYLALLERLDLRDVIVIGSSLGGWIAAEMAVRDTTRLSGIVLIDAGGIQVEGHEIVDVFTLTPDELSALSFHNPAPFRVDPATVSPEQIAGRVANFKALEVYGRASGMINPQLRSQLAGVTIPALVIWGASDRVIDPAYGRAYAQELPHARFELISEAGHLPFIEQPRRVLPLIKEFARSISAS